MPHDVASGAGEKTKENAIARVVTKFGWMVSRWAHPHSAAKGAEIGEVITFASGSFQWSFGLIFGSQGIIDAQSMEKRTGPNLMGELAPASKLLTVLPTVKWPLSAGAF